MSIFLCRMETFDGADHWSAVHARDAEDAARAYAEQCESGSGGEMLNDPSNDKECVHVKDEFGRPYRFEITMDWSKDFHVRVQGEVA